MAAFSTLYNEVVEQLHDSSSTMVTRAKEWINFAQQEVSTAAFWPWLLKDEVIAIDAEITTGTAAVTNGDATVTLSSSALPAAMENGQWYFQAGSDTVWYPVESRTSGTVCELVEAYQGTTAAAGTYQLWHVVYSLPSDCWKIADIRNMDYVTKMRPSGYNRIDASDPALQQSGTDSYLWSLMGSDSNGYPQIMFWPPRITEGTQNVRYYKTLTDLSGDSDVSQIPVAEHEILIFGALMRGFRYLADFEQVEANSFEFLRRLNNMKKRYIHQIDGPLVMGGVTTQRNLLDMMQLPVTT
jgi:hypothetical protein